MPSRPANGELLTMKNIETVGSSTATAWMPSGAAASAIVSPMLRPSMPETQTMSPAVASSTSMRSSPANVSSFVRRRPVSTVAVARDFGDRRVDCASCRGRRGRCRCVRRTCCGRSPRRASGTGRLRPALRGRASAIVSKSGSRSVLSSSSVRLAMPASAVGVDDREIGLLVARAELDEEIEDFVDDFCRARVLAIDLVDDDDRAQVELERFAQHEARLRHDAFGRVDQQQHALHHLQHALDLAAEIGVAGRVDDVELDVAVPDRGVLGEDRDAALALERVRIHHARLDVLALRGKRRSA